LDGQRHRLAECALHRLRDLRDERRVVMTTRRILQLGCLTCLGLAVGFAGKVAFAAIPSGNTIYGCYKNDSGVLRVIDPSAGGACNAKSETPLSWAQTGGQGSPGIQGPRGDQGAVGPNGLDGVSNYQIESATATTVYDSLYKTGLATASAACPAGTTATGNGFDLPSTSVSIWDEGGGLAIDGQAGLTVTGATGVTITAYTVCVGDQIEGT
jgi:hypothetical protein